MKKSLLFLSCIMQAQFQAQVPKKIVVEHFTNTNCGLCASRNPGFYTNLNNQAGALHLSFHPSSPYSSCQLYQQAATENDARTNYYGIYGGTPRLVINGNVITPSANYSDNSIFTPYQSLTSPATLKILQTKYNSDSIKVTVIAKTVAAHALGSLALFVALAEDTVFYTGTNGESQHYDVFRKSLGSTTGVNITLPSVVGDSVTYTASAPAQSIWNFSRINATAILQESTNKNLVQAATFKGQGSTSGLREELQEITLVLYPNPAAKEFTIENPFNHTGLEISDLTGRIVFKKNLATGKNQIRLDEREPGIYFITLVGQTTRKTAKLILIGN